MHQPLRLTVDRTAIQSNWRWLSNRAGVEAGAAIKADGYGLGANETLLALGDVGCRTFFVSTWAEAASFGNQGGDIDIVVLHGVGPDDGEAALASIARPVLVTARQVAHWKQIAPDRPCDVMIDTGMNRLGLRVEEAACLDGLKIDTLHSHLASADEDSAQNAAQLSAFKAAASSITATRLSLANSAGICLGRDYSFDLVRPGLALYGGIPRAEAASAIKPVFKVEAQIVQRRTIRAGESCGYGATWTASADTEAAIINIGYADGYFRGFSSRGRAFADGETLPVIGRVSMDLVILDCGGAKTLDEGDWVDLDYDLPKAAEQSGMSQYELLTGLGTRFERQWS